jgi:hypothetical protein
MDDFNGEPITSMTQIDQYLIVSLSDQMTVEMIESVMDTILGKARQGVKGVLLNYVMIASIDIRSFNAYKKISATLNVMGVPSVWVNLNPGVICSLLDLNVDLDNWTVCTAGNLNDGISLLEKGRGEKEQGNV